MVFKKLQNDLSSPKIAKQISFSAAKSVTKSAEANPPGANRLSLNKGDKFKKARRKWMRKMQKKRLLKKKKKRDWAIFTNGLHDTVDRIRHLSKKRKLQFLSDRTEVNDCSRNVLNVQ